MSGVNSKVSRSDLTPPSAKRLKLDNSRLTPARLKWMTERMESTTSTESSADRVPRIPDELLAHIFGYLAADLETLGNVRLVCQLWKREAFFALKTLLPWIQFGDEDDLISKVKISSSESGNNGRLVSGSSLRNLKPGCGVPHKVLVPKWTPKLESFLRKFSEEIVCLVIVGDEFHGYPEDLGGLELPALEQAPFSAFIREGKEECDDFVKALKFWKKLVKTSKNLKPSNTEMEIYLTGWFLGDKVSPDHEIFDVVEWNQVRSLGCNYEFFTQVIASNELPKLGGLVCGSGSSVLSEDHPPLQLSLEKAANLAELDLSRLAWTLNYQMKNLKVLTLRDVRMICGPSPSEFLPNLQKITVNAFREDEETGPSPFSCLVSGGGVYENAEELELSDLLENMNEGRGDMVVQLCDSFPNLKRLEWKSEESIRASRFPRRNSLTAAPVIFANLELLTGLKLTVAEVSEQEVVELVSGVTLGEIPEEEGSWPTALAGNPRSIVNLKHLQSFDLSVTFETRQIAGRHARFLFTAAFRTMATLKELHFKNITFEDDSCATEWQQLGRKIKVEFGHSRDIVDEITGTLRICASYV